MQPYAVTLRKYCAQPEIWLPAAAGPWMIESRNASLSFIHADEENMVSLWSGHDDENNLYPIGGSGITQSGGWSGGFGRAFGGGFAELPVAPVDEEAPPPVGVGRAFGSGGGGEGAGPACAFLLSSSAADCCWFIITIGCGSQVGGTACAGGYRPSLGRSGTLQLSMCWVSVTPWATWLDDVVVRKSRMQEKVRFLFSMASNEPWSALATL